MLVPTVWSRSVSLSYWVSSSRPFRGVWELWLLRTFELEFERDFDLGREFVDLEVDVTPKPEGGTGILLKIFGALKEDWEGREGWELKILGM